MSNCVERVKPLVSTVSRPFSPGGRPLKCYVGNLKPECRMTHLRQLFGPFGPVVNIELKPTIGCGFVEFEDADSCAEAVSHLNGTEILGQKVRVEAQRVGHPSHNRRVIPPGRSFETEKDNSTLETEPVSVDHTNAAQVASKILNNIFHPSQTGLSESVKTCRSNFDGSVEGEINSHRRHFRHPYREPSCPPYKLGAQESFVSSSRDAWIAPREEYDPRHSNPFPPPPSASYSGLPKYPPYWQRADTFERNRYFRNVENSRYSYYGEYDYGRVPLEHSEYPYRARSRSPGYLQPYERLPYRRPYSRAPSSFSGRLPSTSTQSNSCFGVENNSLASPTYFEHDRSFQTQFRYPDPRLAPSTSHQVIPFPPHEPSSHYSHSWGTKSRGSCTYKKSVDVQSSNSRF